MSVAILAQGTTQKLLTTGDDSAQDGTILHRSQVIELRFGFQYTLFCPVRFGRPGQDRSALSLSLARGCLRSTSAAPSPPLRQHSAQRFSPACGLAPTHREVACGFAPTLIAGSAPPPGRARARAGVRWGSPGGRPRVFGFGFFGLFGRSAGSVFRRGPGIADSAGRLPSPLFSASPSFFSSSSAPQLSNATRHDAT